MGWGVVPGVMPKAVATPNSMISNVATIPLRRESEPWREAFCARIQRFSARAHKVTYFIRSSLTETMFGHKFP